MDRKIAGLLGAVAGLATVGSAQAATHPATDPSEDLGASSYADLLTPIPNAMNLLQADNSARAQSRTSPSRGGIELAYHHHRHHHHHDHHHHHAHFRYYGPGYYYRPHHHHHHHHHHNGVYFGFPGVGVEIGR